MMMNRCYIKDNEILINRYSQDNKLLSISEAYAYYDNICTVESSLTIYEVRNLSIFVKGTVTLKDGTIRTTCHSKADDKDIILDELYVLMHSYMKKQEFTTYFTDIVCYLTIVLQKTNITFHDLLQGVDLHIRNINDRGICTKHFIKLTSLSPMKWYNEGFDEEPTIIINVLTKNAIYIRYMIQLVKSINYRHLSISSVYTLDFLESIEGLFLTLPIIHFFTIRRCTKNLLCDILKKTKKVEIWDVNSLIEINQKDDYLVEELIFRAGVVVSEFMLDICRVLPLFKNLKKINLSNNRIENHWQFITPSITSVDLENSRILPKAMKNILNYIQTFEHDHVISLATNVEAFATRNVLMPYLRFRAENNIKGVNRNNLFIIHVDRFDANEFNFIIYCISNGFIDSNVEFRKIRNSHHVKLLISSLLEHSKFIDYSFTLSFLNDDHRLLMEFINGIQHFQCKSLELKFKNSNMNDNHLNLFTQFNLKSLDVAGRKVSISTQAMYRLIILKPNLELFIKGKQIHPQHNNKIYSRIKGKFTTALYLAKWNQLPVDLLKTICTYL